MFVLDLNLFLQPTDNLSFQRKNVLPFCDLLIFQLLILAQSIQIKRFERFRDPSDLSLQHLLLSKYSRFLVLHLFLMAPLHILRQEVQALLQCLSPVELLGDFLFFRKSLYLERVLIFPGCFHLNLNEVHK